MEIGHPAGEINERILHDILSLDIGQAGFARHVVDQPPVRIKKFAPTGLVFAVASFSAQCLLRREYRPLIARQPSHRGMLRTWIVIYVFVGIQMGWVLRPFVGSPTARVEFFREDSWSNAYVAVAEMILKKLAALAAHAELVP